MDEGVRGRNLAAVRKLCEQWHVMTLDEYRDCMTPDCLYINIPSPDRRRIGPDEAHQALSPWRDRCRITLEVIHILGDESVVLTERLERFVAFDGSGPVIDLYVMGAFEMRDGKIASWRDYFEKSQSPVGQFPPATQPA